MRSSISVASTAFWTAKDMKGVVYTPSFGERRWQMCDMMQGYGELLDGG